MKFFALRNPAWNSLDIHLRQDKTIATSINYVDIEPGRFYEPVIKLADDQAEQLMTELWNAGVRPRNMQNVHGELNATKYHLEDMRKLANVN